MKKILLIPALGLVGCISIDHPGVNAKGEPQIVARVDGHKCIGTVDECVKQLAPYMKGAR